MSYKTPESMQPVPYIMFNGNCEEALQFYAKALGGEIRELMRFEGSPVEDMSTDGQQVMHATFVAGDLRFMASDGGNASGSGMVHLSLDFPDAASQQRAFDAMAEGGTITMALNDTFWGARFGMLTDKFGVQWMFNHDKPQQ